MSSVHIPDLTPGLLAELGRELGGCDFTDPNQKNFLACEKSCDVQAAPGNGKTTLLVAKLALLSGVWTSKQKGVCVISHTNVAREEVEKKLSTYPAAAVFLGYPHFIGTVTAFVHQYVALPYLRGLGWDVKWIDDDFFAARALSIASKDSRLQKWKHSKAGGKFRYRQIISTMTFDRRSLRLHQAKSMPKSGVVGEPAREALESVKEQATKEGVYRFADMTALAFKAIEVCPRLVDRARTRFPLVLLDEAQDTDPDQFELLNLLFGEKVAFQRLGDPNQTLFEGAELSSGAQWAPAEDSIPLNETRRFGPEIAAFASRLTVRKAQQIKGMEGEPNRRVLILFDEKTIENVLCEYANEVQLHWGRGRGPKLELWAVASRHTTYGEKKRGAWPRSMVDYHPRYRSEGGKHDHSGGFCHAMRKAATAFKACKPARDVIDPVVSGLVDFLRLHAYEAPERRRLTCGNLWRCLGASNPMLPLGIRRVIREMVLYGKAPWATEPWHQFCEELKTKLGITVVPAGREGLVSAFLKYDEQGSLVGGGGGGSECPENRVNHEGVTVRLGSVHSVKGRTVDAILVLESQVYKESSHVMDLEVVLPHAFGVCKYDFQKNPAGLTAATNVFVAITRPRQLLALALRKNALPEEVVDVARGQGWVIRDLTADEQSVDGRRTHVE
jgi:hypothetical protein